MILTLRKLELFETNFLNSIISKFQTKKSNGLLVEIERKSCKDNLLISKFDNNVCLTTSTPKNIDGAAKTHIFRIFFNSMNFNSSIVTKIEKLKQEQVFNHKPSGLNFVKTSPITCLMVLDSIPYNTLLKKELKWLNSSGKTVSSGKTSNLFDELKKQKELRKKVELNRLEKLNKAKPQD